MRRLAWLVALLAMVRPAAAHPVPFSYLDLRLDAAMLGGTLTVHVFDAAHDLGIDPPERLLDPRVALDGAPALQALLASRLSLAGDGRPLRITWGSIEVLADRQSLRLPFALAPARGQTGVGPGSDRGQTGVRPPV